MKENEVVHEEYILQPHSALTRKILGREPAEIPKERIRNPKTKKNIVSRLTWGWLSPLMYTGFNRVLEINDLFKINEKEAIEPMMVYYKQSLHRLTSKGTSNAHWKAICLTIKWRFIWAFLVTLLAFGAALCLSVVNRPMIELISEIYAGTSNNKGHAAAYAVGNTLITALYMILILWSGYYFHYIGQVLRCLVIAAVYDKTMHLSAYGHSQYPSASITALVTNDATRIYAATRWTAQMLAAIPGGGAALGILLHNIGVSALAGFAVIIIGCVATIFSSRWISKYRGKSMPFAMKRISAVSETVENMRILKYYGWETSYSDLTKKYRKQEQNFLIKLGRVESTNAALITAVPYFAGLVAFAVRSVLSKTLDPARVFPSLTLFMTYAPLASYFCNGFNAHSEAYVSYKQIRDFFAADELSEDGNNFVQDPHNAIEVNGGTFEWVSPKQTPKHDKQKKGLREFISFFKFKIKPDGGAVEMPEKVTVPVGDTESPTSQISNLTVNILKGKLTMVVGSTGSGKSSLLSAFCGIMPKKHGLIAVDGDITPITTIWAMSSSVRNNVVFGAELDQEAYDKTIEVCGLRTDIASFTDGDLTEIGERGVTLSGGQKARLALARGVYNAKDIVLLDDVLSAVDSKVGKHIFEKCIVEYLGDRTRIMSTNNPKLLKYADQVIFMKSGAAQVGTLAELRTNHDFNALLQQELEKEEQEEEKEQTEAQEEQQNEQQALEEEHGSDSDVSTKSGEDEKKEKTPTKPLMEDENRTKGRMQWIVLNTYFKMGGALWMIPLIIALLCLGSTANVFQNIFLNWWTSNRYHHDNNWYIGIYAAIIIAMWMLSICLQFILCQFCLKASSGMHNSALANIYRAPMSYFDTTPLGRIITRLTDDVAKLDLMIFMYMRMALPGITTCIAIMIVIFVYIPYAILGIIPVLLISLVSIYYYRLSSREIARINGVFRSSTFSHITETMGGLEIITSYGQVDTFTAKLYDHIDDFSSSTFINTASQFWVAWRILISTLPLTFIVTMLCAFRVFHISISSVAMLLAMLPEMFVSVASTLIVFVELEKELNSVERIYELGFNIPQESTAVSVTPPASWPSQGSIDFEDASMRYRPELPLVLNDFSVNVAGGEKIGICGRTGAGKSSLLTALFRIVELDSGSIKLDGVDIAAISLQQLRNHLSIIPQDPVLFAGTIRTNLDPFEKYSDAELESALLRSKVAASDSDPKKFALDAQVQAKGTNFSLGQRQLLTLARALVWQSKVIALDEATANVDQKTDVLVQKTISSEFKASTILCIAHRLNTILHYDRIIVMSHGRIAELGTPLELFAKGGEFKALCVESGLDLQDIERARFNILNTLSV